MQIEVIMKFEDMCMGSGKEYAQLFEQVDFPLSYILNDATDYTGNPVSFLDTEIMFYFMCTPLSCGRH